MHLLHDFVSLQFFGFFGKEQSSRSFIDKISRFIFINIANNSKLPSKAHRNSELLGRVLVFLG